MESLINTDIKKLLSFNMEVPFEIIESSLLGAILRKNNINKVKNIEIKKILALNSNTKDKVDTWIKNNIKNLTIQHALTLYELRVSAEGRKFDGAYYTPQVIVDSIVDLTIKDKIGFTCDPSCGSGAFLLGAVKKLKINGAGSIRKILSKYIYGVDIDSSNIQNSKRILSIYAIIEGEDEEHYDFSIFQGNSLVFNWEQSHIKCPKFDFIVGNPPYVRGKNLTPETKKQIKKWSTADVGIADLYIPFFEIGLSWANKEGRLGYITPNTYFSSINGRKIRKMLSESKIIEKIIDFGGFPAFEGLLTYTCVSILDKKTISNPLVGVVDKITELQNIKNVKLYPINYSELSNDDWYIQPQKLAEEMRKIENIGIPLNKYVPRFTTGIATLKNDLYILKGPINKGYILVEKDGKKWKIEEQITVSIIKPNRIKNKIQLKNNIERIIYPYFLSEKTNRPILMEESNLKNKFPGAYSYLLHYKKELKNRSLDTKTKWYAYGRSQALDGFGKKIIFPMMSDQPAFLAVEDPKTLIYCGYALYPESERKTLILLKIMNSSFFWNYIKNTSKNYSGGYKSLAKNYVKKFSIPIFNEKEEKILLSLDNIKLDDFLKKKYQID